MSIYDSRNKAFKAFFLDPPDKCATMAYGAGYGMHSTTSFIAMGRRTELKAKFYNE